MSEERPSFFESGGSDLPAKEKEDNNSREAGFKVASPELLRHLAQDPIEEENPFAKTPYTLTASQQRYLKFKRLFDVCFACLGLALFLPFGLILALLIKLSSPGPVLFRQSRIGLHRKVFTIYKFRSMRMDAPPAIATANFVDSKQYIPPIGSFLRRTSLDEVPQLLNVIKGDMSLIGYRPLIYNEREMDQRREQLGVYQLRPGLSGYAQINGRDKLGTKEKSCLDRQYLERCSLACDWKIFWHTVRYVLTRKDVAF